MELAVIVILLHDDIGGVQPVHPSRHSLIVLALAGDGVHQHGAVNIRAAEQTDGLDNAGTDPVGLQRQGDGYGKGCRWEDNGACTG